MEQTNFSIDRSMSSGKPVVLAFARYYLPGYKAGGPIRSIANLVDHLNGDIEFRIIASDRDAFDALPYSGVKADAWNPIDGALVYYVSPAKRTLRELLRLIR